MLRAQGGMVAVDGVLVVRRAALEHVVRVLRYKPSKPIIGAAIVLALAAHAVLGWTGASARPSVRRTERVAMALATPAEELVAPPPPPPRPIAESGGRAPSADVPVSASSSMGTETPGLPGWPLPTSTFGAGGVGAGRGSAPDAPPPADPVVPPKVVQRTAPRYPPEARARQLEGVVVVEALVDERGSVIDVRVAESEPLGVFDAAAIAAVRRFVFTPARQGDAAVRAWVRQRFRFVTGAAGVGGFG